MEKQRLPSKETGKRCIVNYTKMLFRIKGDDWQSHPLREVVSTVPLYEFRPITSIHHIMGSVKSAPPNPYFMIPDDVIES